MTIFNDILNVLPPDYPTHSVFELTDRFSQPVFLSFTQAGDIAPDAAVMQDVPAVFGKFVFYRTNRKPSIRLAHVHIMPFSLFARIDHIGA